MKFASDKTIYNLINKIRSIMHTTIVIIKYNTKDLHIIFEMIFSTISIVYLSTLRTLVSKSPEIRRDIRAEEPIKLVSNRKLEFVTLFSQSWCTREDWREIDSIRIRAFQRDQESFRSSFLFFPFPPSSRN